jgi:hypothetical protein
VREREPVFVVVGFFLATIFLATVFFPDGCFDDAFLAEFLTAFLPVLAAADLDDEGGDVPAVEPGRRGRTSRSSTATAA